jgi:hypothetical protein
MSDAAARTKNIADVNARCQERIANILDRYTLADVEESELQSVKKPKKANPQS